MFIVGFFIIIKPYKHTHIHTLKIEVTMGLLHMGYYTAISYDILITMG